MDILKTWFEDGQERATLYRNIDPESFFISGSEIGFAHIGYHKKGSASTLEHYRISMKKGMPLFITDPVLIEQEMKRFDFPEALGLYNQTAYLKND